MPRTTFQDAFKISFTKRNPPVPQIQSLNTLDPFLSRLYFAAALALALHYLVFKKGEWHLKSPLILSIWLISYPLLFLTELIMNMTNLSASFVNPFWTLGCFTVVMFTSIAVYRLYFHRLGAFEGPPLARVSKLWHSYQCLQGKNHLLLDDLHKRYGDYIRTGQIPFEITSSETDAT